MDGPALPGFFVWSGRASSQRMRKTKMGVNVANGHSFD